MNQSTELINNHQQANQKKQNISGITIHNIYTYHTEVQKYALRMTRNTLN